MAQVVERVREAAATDAPVLIEGEPGTGRELVARAIHYAGRRRRHGFVAVKATTIPRDLLASELFGPRSVTLRRASGGTLLVKDVDALPPVQQRGLARVLRGGEGGRGDVRVIGASDGDVQGSVAACSFDRDLYDRLAARIHIPPLRRRLEDLPRLVRGFLEQAGKEIGRSRPRVTDGALERMARYPWPGNVAELKDVCRRLVRALKGPREAVDLTAVEGVLPKVHERLPLEEMSFEELVRSKIEPFLRRVDGYEVGNLYERVLAHIERPLLALVLEHTQGSQVRAAEILGLNRNTLRKKLAQHDLSAGGARKG
jgi:two-component system, NtrC family, nitrogen regulation response regulator GlnG